MRRRLVQERLPRGPDYGWRMLVACQLLNRTRGAVGVPAALAVLARWPTPAALARADLRSLHSLIRRCGLWRRRSLQLRRLSAAWAAGERDPKRLPGAGRYARDSWAIFVEGRRPRSVGDHWLRYYLESTRRAR